MINSRGAGQSKMLQDAIKFGFEAGKKATKRSSRGVHNDAPPEARNFFDDVATFFYEY